MAAHLFALEWTDFLIRWTHVITAVAWIGSSFYFVHLDLSLKRVDGLPAGAAGEAWQVHGGGFYHMTKYLVAPARMPPDLTWFKWESYATFLSGFALLCVHYYLNPELHLIDRTILPLSPGQAVALSLVTLGLGWLAYDFLCKSKLGENDWRLLIAFFVFLTIAAFAFTHMFSGRGAFIQLGALIGTTMSANVFFVIMPNQRKVVASLLAGERPDPSLGKAAKQRSPHNQYLTLPVVFLMLSNHYPLAFASKWNWLIAALVLLIGALIRHFYNCGHAGKPHPWWTWAASAGLMAIIIWLSALGPGGEFAQERADMTAPGASVQFAQVEEIVTQRCSMCHAKEPVWDGVGSAPKGVLLDSPARIRANARAIGLNAVYTHAMPPGGNITEISLQERAILAAWLASPPSN